MRPHLHTRTLLQALFGLLLIFWPVLDTAPTGAVTPLRIGLGGGMLLLLVPAILTAGCRGQLPKWNPTDWAVLACTVWYVGNVIFIGRGQTDPCYLLTGFIFLTTYAFCRIAGTTLVLPAMLVSGVVQSGIATAQLCGVMVTRHVYYDFTGSFPNPGPLGGWLCIALLSAIILAVRLWKGNRHIWTILCAAGGLYIGVILLLTDSRAAWLGCAAGIFVLLAMQRFRGKRYILSGIAILAFVGAGLLYGYKKDSADGRLLVWRVSADMIAQKPVIGHGVGTFAERYMFAQADYFGRNSDSRFASVAEQTSYPFNELIGTACEQGLVGALLLLLLIGSALLRRGDTSGKILLIGLVVFGLFSYPSVFLSFGLLFAALLACSVNGTATAPKEISPKTAFLLAGTAMMMGAALLYGIAARRNSPNNRYTLVREASDLMCRNDPKDLPRLEQLARRLPIAGFYADLGDLCLETDCTDKAKAYYTQAARMIPSRLRPYDGLFRIYQASGQIDSATVMARHILTMPVKVSNTTTIRLRQSAKEWIETHNPDL